MKIKCETIYPEIQKTISSMSLRCTGGKATRVRTDRYSPDKKKYYLCDNCAALFDEMQAEIRAEARAS